MHALSRPTQALTVFTNVRESRVEGCTCPWHPDQMLCVMCVYSWSCSVSAVAVLYSYCQFLPPSLRRVHVCTCVLSCLSVVVTWRHSVRVRAREFPCVCVCVCVRPLRLPIVICDRKCDRKFSCFVSSRASYVWRSGGCSPACFNVLHVLCHVPLQCSQLAGTRCVVCTMPKRANSCARWPAMTAPSQLFRSLPFPSPLSPFT